MDEQPIKRLGPILWLAERPPRFWVFVAVLSVLYAGSFGPVCWAHSHVMVGGDVIAIVYQPLIQLAKAAGCLRYLEQYAMLRADSQTGGVVLDKGGIQWMYYVSIGC